MPIRLIAAVTAVCVVSGAVAARLAAQAHGPDSGRPSTALRINGPIARWDEALPLGNGLLGALLWGENNVVRISLDRGDLWDLRTPDVLKRPDWTYATMQRLKATADQRQMSALFDDPYEQTPYPSKLPAGRIELVFDPSMQVSAFSLDLSTATAHITVGASTITGRMDAVAKAGVFSITGPQPDVRLIRPAGLDRLGYAAGALASGPDAWSLKQDAALDLSYAIVVQQRPAAGGDRYAFTVAASRTGEDVLAAGRAVVTSVLNGPDQEFGRAHDQWWSRFWSTSSVSVPDAAIQAHYDLAKYFYGAASRSDAPPMPLQGVWTADNGGLPPWKGDYHHDLNTQMTYLAYHEAGLRDQGASFLNQMWDLLPRFRAFARAFYGVDGAVVPGVMALDGRPLGGWGQYSLSPTNGAWNAQTFYLHWKYTLDETFLRDRAYPWCAAIGEALAALLTPDESGRLTLPLSTSPEIFDNSMRAWLPPNTNYDLALLRFLFAANAEMAGALGDETAARRWRALVDRLGPLDKDPASGALTVARGVPYSASHRHFSHAMAIYPLGTLNVEGSDEDRATVAATLNEIEQRGTRQWVGYSFAWYSAMAARAGQAGRALVSLRTFVRAFVGPNGFHLNGDQTKSGITAATYRPFTLEGNFLAMQAVHEMLLQSWGGVVRVFPAVSTDWADASFARLRAEGGWVVSAERRQGRTSLVEVRATRTGLLRLRDPFDGGAATWSRTDIRRDGHDLIVRVAADETLRGQRR
jgi:alpha-L-fucosidase 2